MAVPIHRYFDDEGAQWLPLAERRLIALRSVAKSCGGYANQIYYPEGDDSVSVQVTISPVVERIVILGEEGADLLSGVVTPGRLVDVVENPGTPEEETVNVAESFYPSSIQATIEGKSRIWRQEKKLGVEATFQNKRIFNPYLLFAQAADVCPAQYSGKMVHAAQLALGLNKKEVEYQHSYACTHGIYMAGTTPWLIEISGSGIRAMKLSGTKKASNKTLDTGIKTKFPMIPDGKAFPTGAALTKAVADGKVKTIGNASAYYGKAGPFFLDCGWSFNDLGNEAVNVGWSWPDDYKRGHMFKVSITGDASGPTKAVCLEMESGYLYHPQAATRLNYPTGTSGEMYTFDMKKFGFVQTAPAESWEAPVYAFYTGNTLNVYRHRIFNNLSPYRAGGWVPFDPFNHGPYHSNAGSDIGKTPSSEEVYGVTCEYRPEVPATGMMDYSGPGISDPISIPGGAYTTRKLSEKNCGLKIYDTIEFGYSLGYPVEDWGYKVVMDSYTFYGTQSDGSYQSRTMNHSLSISPRNRSSVFIGENDLTTDAYHRNTELFIGFGFKNTSVVNCYQDDYASSSYIISGSKTAQEYHLGGIPLDYVAKVETGYSHAGSYTPVMIPGPLQAVSNDIFFGGFTGSSGPVGPYHIIGTFDPSPVPPGGIDHGHTIDNAIEILTFSCRNGPLSHEKSVSTPVERESFFKSFSVSPDVLGSYAYLSSGFSGFLNSGYASKLPNGTSGNAIHKVGADGEDTGPWGITTTFVGYS